MTRLRSDPPRLVALEGIPEIRAGDDLAAHILDGLRRAGLADPTGLVLVVASKVVSKAAGLRHTGDRDAAVDAHTRRVVAERATTDRVTRVVEAAAGPVMAAAGVDASNTASGDVLLLPEDPDAAAASVRAGLLRRAGLGADAALGVIVADTAGRAWRAGQTDFALGSAGVHPLLELSGSPDRDGRDLSVTAPAIADELAAAADLARSKASGHPVVAVVGLPSQWLDALAPGARARLVRTGPTDWFALGHVEAVRDALGVPPGSTRSAAVGLRPVGEDPLGARAGRVVALALVTEPEAAVTSVGPAAADPRVLLTVSATSDYLLGRVVSRLEVAAAAEDLRTEPVEPVVPGAGAVILALEPRDGVDHRPAGPW